MRPIKPNTRRRSPWRTVLLALLAIVLGGVGTVALLGATKVIDLGKLAFWRSPETHKETHPAGWIGVPLSMRSIPAYTEITRDHLMSPKTGQLELKWVPPGTVSKAIITDVSKILGRVTAREKPAVYFFKESDFLPEGTRPGIVGGTPQGKRAYTFNASSLDGCVYQVKEGDHVDLLVSVPVDMPGTGHSGALGSNSVIATPDTLLRPKRTLEIPLVQDGVVVSPVTARTTSTTNSSLNGTTTHNARVEEIVIAVAPEEVAPLDEAKALKNRLTCVARSGRPASVPASAAQRSTGGAGEGGMSQVIAAVGKALLGKDSAAAPQKPSLPTERATPLKPTTSETSAKDRVAVDITPGSNPMSEVRFMEVMIGTKRQFMLFNGPGNSPVVATQDDGAAKPAPAAAPSDTPAATPDESEQ